MSYKTIQCNSCGTSFTHPKQRGRPPVRCEPCKTGKTPAKPAKLPQEAIPAVVVADVQLPGDLIPIGTEVRIKPHLWRGVLLDAAYGRLDSYKRDCVGPYAVVIVENERKLARLENLQEK